MYLRQIDKRRKKVRDDVPETERQKEKKLRDNVPKKERKGDRK
jgi:hypothetical protein